MIDGINLVDVSGWTVAAGVCVLVVVGFVRGWLVSGSSARMWFEAWQTDRHTVEKLADQMESLTVGQQVITKFIGDFGDQARAHADQERSP